MRTNGKRFLSRRSLLRILILAAALLLATCTGISDEPIPPEQAALAQQGVDRNQAWQPVIREVAGIPMAVVPAGCFMMGSTEDQLEEAISSCNSFYGAYGCQVDFDHEQPAHRVCLSKPFWIDQTAVTNRQYDRIARDGRPKPTGAEPDWPRDTITWQEAADFCLQRGARLPTEAEWEYAARGPDALIYPFGNQFDLEKATLRKISPAPVGQIPEGASWVGALDMSGGAGEWVQDWYGTYSAEEQVDPTGPSNGEKKILRGGNWFAHAAFFVRAAAREAVDPGYATSAVGFRCAREYPAN